MGSSSLAYTFYLRPSQPNAITKRKYYDFIQNLPIFLPNADIRKKFGAIIDEYPVQPYLKTRDSFVHWVYFIHNRVNKLTGKPEITLHEAMDRYYAQYRTPSISISKSWGVSKGTIHNTVILVLLGYIVYANYKKS